MTTSIRLTAHEFRDLVTPVLPHASVDHNLPVLTAVLVESRGKWLTATATDRFKMGMKRLAKHATDDDPSTEWPEFRALISARSVKNILATFKPSGSHAHAELTLTVDKDRITVESVGSLIDDVASAKATYFLMSGEYPQVDGLLAKALADGPQAGVTGFNWKFLSAFAAAATNRNTPLQFRPGGSTHAAVVIGEDFIGMIMPRRLVGTEYGDDGWHEILSQPAPPAKKATARKAPAKKAAAKKTAASGKAAS